MCYSAQVVQLVKDALRRYDIRMDYTEALKLFLQRRDDPGITISRVFEKNFDEPKNDIERQIKALIDEHRGRLMTKWEAELFKQKTRLNTAQRKLQSKVTKAAENDVRIATTKIEALSTKLANLRGNVLTLDDERIFPFHYAGVIIKDASGYLLTPMRYQCRPAGKPAFYDTKFPGLYNARRDSLEDFWRGQFGKHHALAIIESFFENVKQHDLEHRELAPGEKEQNVVLQFNPTPATDMLVACVWSHWTDPSAPDLRSFAVITDDPPAEVAAAGHNRCPINLKAENVEAWLTPQGRSDVDLQSILEDKQRPFYQHAVMAA